MIITFHSFMYWDKDTGIFTLRLISCSLCCDMLYYNSLKSCLSQLTNKFKYIISKWHQGLSGITITCMLNTTLWVRNRDNYELRKIKSFLSFDSLVDTIYCSRELVRFVSECRRHRDSRNNQGRGGSCDRGDHLCHFLFVLKLRKRINKNIAEKYPSLHNAPVLVVLWLKLFCTV